jgi:hypothetical protein
MAEGGAINEIKFEPHWVMNEGYCLLGRDIGMLAGAGVGIDGGFRSERQNPRFRSPHARGGSYARPGHITISHEILTYDFRETNGGSMDEAMPALGANSDWNSTHNTDIPTGPHRSKSIKMRREGLSEDKGVGAAGPLPDRGRNCDPRCNCALRDPWGSIDSTKTPGAGGTTHPPASIPLFNSLPFAWIKAVRCGVCV